MARTITTGQYAEPLSGAAPGTPATRSGVHGVYTLSNSTDYYAEINTQTSPCVSVHLQWNSALVATITFETSDFAPVDVSTVSTTAGDWIQQNPATAYIPITGTGASVANMTITLAGGGAGGGQVNLSAFAPARLRVKVAVTTAGTIRIGHSGKAAS